MVLPNPGPVFYTEPAKKGTLLRGKSFVSAGTCTVQFRQLLNLNTFANECTRAVGLPLRAPGIERLLPAILST